MAPPLVPYVDPDYWNLLGRRAPAPQPPQTDLHAIRSTTNAALKAASEAMVFPAGMATSVNTVVSLDGTLFNITRFVPLAVQQQQQQRDEADGPAPAQRAVIYVFGGGLIAGGVDIAFNRIANYAQQVGAQVFAPNYRLAPEHPYPAALDDIYASITWLQAHAREFNIDPARIITCGQSAGAGLVAAVALKARDEALDPPIAAQVLRYPMLDDRTQMDLDDPRYPYLTWLPSSNAISWAAYLGSLKSDSTSHDETNKSIPYTAAPARAQDLRSLPPTCLGVGGLDLFRDETISFGTRLSTHDVKVQYIGYPGVPHGFDGSPAFSSRLALWADEVRFIQGY